MITPAPALRAALAACASLFIAGGLTARDLLVDARGGADYATLAAAAAAAQPGDTLILAKGSGPYRETLYIKRSGTETAPIVVEGNGETVTALVPLKFQPEGDSRVARLPLPFPCVITHNGERILQDPAAPETAFLGPIRLRDDKRTVELLPGASPEGWEASAADCPVRVVNASWHTYRNLVATGGTNDGFNLHGEGKGLVFENIVGANNLDEGFSPHDGIVCEINGGDFWGNDNGVAGGPDYALTNVRIHDNLGWGLVLNGTKRIRMTDVSIWGNGMAQVIFNAGAGGSAERVRVWTPSWPSRPWRSYKESATSKAPALAFRFDDQVDRAAWQGFPRLADTPPPSTPKAAASASPTLAIHAAAAAAAPAPTPVSPAAVNFTRLIRDAIQSGQTTLKLPSGVHRIDELITIKDARNLVIDGSETTLVMTNNRRGVLYISGGDRLAIKGLTIDYDPLPYTQGTVTKADARSFEFEIHDGYPDIAAGPTHLFTPEGNRLPDALDFYQPRLEILTPRKGVAHAADKWPASLAPGDQVVIDRRGGNNAVEIRDTTGPVLLEDVTLLASPSLGVAGRYCEDTVTFRRFKLAAGPVPPGATKPRLFSTNADAINFVQCRRGPVLEHCDISRQGDDALNVHGMFLPIVRVVSPTRFLTVFPYGPGGFVKPLRAGDPLRIYAAPDFAITGDATFASITALAAPGDITAAEVKKCFPTYGASTFTVYQVDLAQPARLDPGQWFDSPAVNGDGFIVRDSYFHDNRGRGLRVMASGGLIENNRFERITKSAISIGPELGYWREAGWVKNLRVTGNTLRDIGVDESLSAIGSYVPGAIGIFVRTDTGKPPYQPGNEDIVIENNTIVGSSVSGIHAYAAAGLTIRNNTLQKTNLVRASGWSDPVTRLSTSGPISTDGALRVTLTDNTATP